VRTLAAIAAIAIIVAAVYVFSIVPYLISASQGRRPDQVSPGLEVIIPATALPLILVLVFLVPARRKVGKREERGREEQEEKISDAEKKDLAQQATTIAAATKEDEVEELKERPQSYEQIGEKRFRRSSLLAGTIGGLIAASVLVGLIFLGDTSLGFPIGTFYSIITIAIAGSIAKAAAIYFGLALHLMTGTAIGAIFGYLSAAIGPFNIMSLPRGVGVGILVGFISFSLLFIPITRFEVEHALMGIVADIEMTKQGSSSISIDQALLETRTTDIMSSVLVFSIVFHVIYGAIMGFITALMLLHVFPRTRRQQRRTVP
jgi:ABC-type multidrug transport system fused ATPase/permease subunit